MSKKPKDGKVIFVMSGTPVAKFFIPGQPVPAERVRHGRGNRFYTPAKSRDYRKHVLQHLPPEVKRMEPIKDPSLVCFFCRETRRRADIDNLLKAIQDALLGIVYTDDTDVRFVLGGKLQSTDEACTPGVNVIVLSGAKVEVA